LSSLLGGCALVAVPAAFALSLIGVFKDRPRGWAIAGLVLSALPAVLVLVGLVAAICV